jgi:histidinol dehydrogenase
VQKIVGPGNAYVTAAKRFVAFDCAIDFLAGPTEALILSERGKPEFIASDLIAQAEHDVAALVLFITTSRKLAQAVVEVVERLAQGNPTAQASLQKGAVCLASSKAQAREWANRIAPEHITVDEEDAPFIQNAGSIFVGDYSAQAAGDYASGPNHVLPTAGQARFRGGLSVLDFVKIISVQKLSRRGLRSIAPAIECLATAEGLQGHADSIRARHANA